MSHKAYRGLKWIWPIGNCAMPFLATWHFLHVPVQDMIPVLPLKLWARCNPGQNHEAGCVADHRADFIRRRRPDHGRDPERGQIDVLFKTFWSEYSTNLVLYDRIPKYSIYLE